MTNVIETEPVGVFGIGSLGSSIASSALLAGREVVAFDPFADIETNVFGKIDKVDQDIAARLHTVETPEEVIEGVRFIHWAAELNQLPTLPRLRSNLGVLHDSVMTNSIIARGKREDGDQFAVVHRLMNDTSTTAVAEGVGPHKAVSTHMAKLGFLVRRIDAEEHDRRLGADAQCLLALLIGAGIRDSLLDLEARDMLTPSAAEMLRVLTHRDLKWTEATLRSLRANPFLSDTLQRLADQIPEDHIQRGTE